MFILSKGLSEKYTLIISFDDNHVGGIELTR